MVKSYKEDIKRCKEDIKVLKGFIKEQKENENVNEYKIKSLENGIKDLENKIKGYKKAIRDYRISKLLNWVKDKARKVKNFVSKLIKKLKKEAETEKEIKYNSQETELLDLIEKEEIIEVKEEIIEVKEEEITVEPVISSEVYEPEVLTEETMEVIDIELPVQEVKKENNKELNIDKELAKAFGLYVSKNFKELNSLNKNLFKEMKPGSIQKATNKGAKKTYELISGFKPAIKIVLDDYVKDSNNVEDFVIYVIKNNIKNFNTVNQF